MYEITSEYISDLIYKSSFFFRFKKKKKNGKIG